jgi:hypothetical protein
MPPVAAHAPTESEVIAAAAPATTAMVEIRFTGSPCFGLDDQKRKGALTEQPDASQSVEMS